MKIPFARSILLTGLVLSQSPIVVAAPNATASSSQKQIPGETLPDIEKQLQIAKEKLKRLSSSDTLKVAALDWAVLECERLIGLAGKSKEPGLTKRAAELAADIITAVDNPQLAKKQTEPKMFFPEIRDMAKNNGAKDLFKLNPYLGVTPSNLKKTASKPELGDMDATILAYTFMHPQSPARGNAKAIIPLLSTLNQSWCIRDKMNWSEHYPIIAYILLKSVYPNLVLPSVKAEWERVMKERSEAMIAKYTPVFDDHYTDRSWLNSDIRDTTFVGFAGIALNNPQYKNWMDKALLQIYKTLQPDGATNYTAYQNECWPYHDAVLGCMAWYTLFFNNETSRKYLSNSAPYYPLTTHRSIGEYYTAPEQKHYYNGATCQIPYPGYLAKDPYAVSISSKVTNDLLVAFYFDGTMKDVTLPDNYTLFDRNIIGPRGRYGNLDFAISTRDFSYYPGKTASGDKVPNLGFGVTSFLGMRVMYTPEDEAKLKPGSPMNAVVERIMNQVTSGSRVHDKGQDMDSSVSIAGSATGVSARYATSGRAGQNEKWTPLPFNNIQEWVVTQDRAVGILKIEATKEVKNSRMSTVFQFVSGRDKWGIRKEFKKLDTWTYQYGDLKIRIIETSYKEIETNYANGGLTGGDNMRGILRLVEEKGQSNKMKTYQAGNGNWCLVEITPTWKTPAKEIKMLKLDHNLIGFEFTDAEKTIALIHNPTDAPETAALDLHANYSKYSLHLGTDSKVDRDKYMNRLSWDQKKALDSGNRSIPLPSAKVSYAVPPQRHILLLGSQDSKDHASGMKFYENVFRNP